MKPIEPGTEPYVFKSIRVLKTKNERINILFLDEGYSTELYAALVLYKKKFGRRLKSVFLIGEEARCLWKEKIELSLVNDAYAEFLEIMAEKRVELSFEASSDFNEKLLTGLELRVEGKVGLKWELAAKDLFKVLNAI